METATADKKTYVAICPQCKGIWAAAVDEPSHRKDTAKEVRRWVSWGANIQTWTVQQVRDGNSCSCKK